MATTLGAPACRGATTSYEARNVAATRWLARFGAVLAIWSASLPDAARANTEPQAEERAPSPGQAGWTENLFADSQTTLLGDMYGLRSWLDRFGIELGLQETSELFEFEINEPGLWLHVAPQSAVERFARATLARLSG